MYDDNSQEGSTALIDAAKEGRTEAVMKLISARAKINLHDNVRKINSAHIICTCMCSLYF